MNLGNIFISVAGILVTALITFFSERLIVFLNSKVSNVKYTKYYKNAVEIVMIAVKVTYQTYVEDLKQNGAFNNEEKQKALDKTSEMILSQMSCDMQKYINANFGNIETWIKNTIEAIIYDLKRINN